jgi:hypothetical protein
MGFLDSIGNAARKAQLHTEISLVDRELIARKRAFGVELYDKISTQRKQTNQLEAATAGVFQAIENTIKDPLTTCSDDIHRLELECSEKKREKELIEIRQEKAALGEKNAATNTMSKRITNQATLAQLAVQTTLLEREMKQRKEQFGLEVWDVVSSPRWLHETIPHETTKKNSTGDGGLTGTVSGAVNGLLKGTKGTIAKTLGKMSSKEREIEECVNKAKEDVYFLETKRSNKVTEIDVINRSK